MALKKIYTCDLCGMKRDPGCLRGINFDDGVLVLSVTSFKPESEKHICKACVIQLRFIGQSWIADKHTEIDGLKLEIEQLKTANKSLQDRIDVLIKLL